MTIKNLLRFFGYFLTVVSFYFIYSILKEYDFVAIFINRSVFFYLSFILLIFGYSLLVFLSAFSWKFVLEFVSKKKMPTFDIFKIYIQTNIAKYLPGNVLHYVARNVAGVKLGWTHRQLAISSIIELVLLVTVPTLILVVFLLLGLLKLPVSISFSLSNNVSWIFTFTILVLIVLVIAALYFKKYKHHLYCKFKSLLIGYLKGIVSMDFHILISKIFILSLIGFFYNGFLFYSFAYIFNIDLPLSNFISVVSVLSIAGYSGILTPGVPGGIGVKESVAVVMLATYGYVKGDMMLLLIATRVSSILSEVVAYVASFAFNAQIIEIKQK